ncbi:MAG: enoyl-CoA hydratase/isomerase family protein [Actinobacteria bacterium]|nr:enoyl-CoA hydratase/isomerase family protein [Actinomycetota bacterium]
MVELEHHGAVALLTLNRPEALNALSGEIVELLAGHVTRIGDEPAVRAVVITGAGDRAFSAGADLALMRTATPSTASEIAGRGHALFNRIAALRVPVIAAINGYCLGGGCELALACDIRLASENAQIGLPEVTLGIFPGWGGTQRLPRIVGPGHAMEMITTGRRLTAAEAERIGLVNRVMSQADLLPAAMSLAADIAARAPLGVAAAKELVRASLSTDLSTGLAHERDRFALMFATRDQREGMDAFFEKRPAEFTGE